MCGRPLWRKNNLLDWCSARSGADMCAAFDAARLTRRRPGWEFADQVQVRPTRLKRLSQSWLSRSRLSDRGAIPLLLTLPRLDSLAVVATPTPPQPELDKPHPWPAAPRRSGPSCWPAPPAPASAACKQDR